MTLAFKTTILLAGKQVPTFKEIRLHQEIHSHHVLEARFPWQVFEKEEKELGDKSKEFLAETFSIQITSEFNNKEIGELVFKGIVTGINIVKSANTQAGDEIVLIVSSPEIMADGGSNFSSFHEMDVGAIVKRILDRNSLKSNVNASYTDKINYIVQYKESDFEFIQRLSEQYGQWLYYNGEELVFGKPDSKETELHYKFDLTDYNINLIPLSLPSAYFSSDYMESSFQKETPSSPSTKGFNSTVLSKSKDVFKSTSSVWANTNNEVATNSILKHKAKVQQEGIAINQVKITGSSKSPNVSVGRVIKIEGVKYRIIKVDHFLNRSGQYENQFEGVSANQEGYPKTNINSFPVSQSQLGMVIDNEDPDALGRIKVKLTWQELKGEETPWIRMTSPHSGDGKGFHFIPEIGEEVLVDFEGGDAESPYVLGTVYNSKNKTPDAWNTSKNDFKSIRTRSGHTIQFNDTQGEEKIEIYDVSNDKVVNHIIYDTKAKSLTIQSVGTINLKGSEINIEAQKNINITAKEEINMTSEKDMAILSKMKLALQSALDATFKSDKAIDIQATADVGIKGLNTVIEGSAGAELNGGKTKVSGKIMTEVSGAIVKIN